MNYSNIVGKGCTFSCYVYRGLITSRGLVGTLRF